MHSCNNLPVAVLAFNLEARSAMEKWRDGDLAPGQRQDDGPDREDEAEKIRLMFLTHDIVGQCGAVGQGIKGENQ